MGIKVAELNTLSDGKGITGIRVFNEMEDTNESTNVRKLADVWMSKNRCCPGHRNRSARLCHSSRSRVPNLSRASIAAAQPLKHVETRKNEVLNSIKNETILPDMRHWKLLTCAEIICEHCRQRHGMQRHHYMCEITESIEHGVGNRRWRSSLKAISAGVSERPGSRFRPV